MLKLTRDNTQLLINNIWEVRHTSRESSKWKVVTCKVCLYIVYYYACCLCSMCVALCLASNRKSRGRDRCGIARAQNYHTKRKTRKDFSNSFVKRLLFSLASGLKSSCMCRDRLKERMLQIPAKQKLTKWEEYARQKGITKTKKSRKVFDEKTKVRPSSV